nr:uncharacterized protein LOC114819789 [Malus domestica]
MGEGKKLDENAYKCHTSAKAKAYYNYAANDLYYVDEENSNEVRKYDLTGIPCNHALSAIHFKREKLEDYMDVFYSNARYLEVYSHLIMPMNGMSLWEDTEKSPILPPLYTRQPRRPRNKRNKDAVELEKNGEQTSTNPPNNPKGPPKPFKLGRKGQGALKCTIWKQEGHNSRTHHRHLPLKDKQASTLA